MSPPARTTPEEAPARFVPLRLPTDPEAVFERRAARLHRLASGHAIGDYLTALAHLAEAQRRAYREIAVTGGADGPALPYPLRMAVDRLGTAWRAALSTVLAEMGKVPLPVPAQVALTRLEQSAASELEACADALLDGRPEAADPTAAPFVGAALQVCWTRLASQLQADAVATSLLACPVCGSPPVAGTVDGFDRLRYLTCSLCAAQWHLTRVMCATCGATSGLVYFAVEGDPGAAKAEACAQCHTYLKLFYLAQDAQADPFVDDLATLSLDLLMAEQGFARGGVNFFLHSPSGSRPAS
jgi:FdhE protein